MRRFFTAIVSIVLLINTSQAQCWQKIASTYDHVLAIHEDGTLWTWGGAFSGYRQNNYPVQKSEANDWVSISTGFYTNAAIKADGTLWMWGENGFGQLGQGNTTNLWVPTQVGTDNNWLQVSCGEFHTAAIKTDGTLWLWGKNDNGQMGAGLNRTSRLSPGQLGTDTDWVEVSAGMNHTLIRKSTNAMWFVGACYSSSINSQLRQVGSTLDWRTMGAGAYTDYGIKQNGTLWKWVNSNGGPSGLAQVGNQNNWNKIGNCIGYSVEAHALFIKTNGTLWAIGTNNFGQLGNGSLTYITDIPQQIGTDNDWKQVVAGALYSLALKNNNSFWAWGRNQHAQFGNGHNKNKARAINDNQQWKEVISGKGSFNGHTAAINQDGTLWTWGPNQDGQLGIGPPAYAHKPLPQQVGTDNTWKQITAGFHFTVGVKEDGTMWGWGRNGSGQLGLGGLWSTTTPIQIGTDTDWIMAASSSTNTIAIKENGTLWAFGFNQNGELGIGNTQERDTPVQVGNDTTWIYVHAGDQHSLGIKEDGSLWSWGNNAYGQLGRSGLTTVPNRVGTDTWLRVEGGGLHTLGIKSDSTLWAWGRNLYAQLGDGGTTNKSQPYQINAEHKWKNISGGYEHSLATTVDSSLFVWGRNAAGNLTDSLSYIYYPNNVYTPLQIYPEQQWLDASAGVYNSAFIRSDSRLLTAGDAYSQEFQSNFPVLGYVDWSPQQINICNSCPSTSYQYSQSICAGDSVLFDGIYRMEAGNYYDTLINAIGCDSLITFNLIVKNPIHFTDTHLACETFLWIDGITYNENNNTAIHIYENAASNGCDSIVHLNLTILQPVHFNDIQTACESFEWLDGMTYTENNNTAIYIYENAATNGCDSIVHLNLMIHNPVHFTDMQTACESFEWIDGMTYTEDNNTEIYIYESGAANGCDSIVHLHLTIHSLNNAVISNGNTLTSQQSSVDYQWIDCDSDLPIDSETNMSFSPSVSGSYAVILTDEFCSIQSECNSVTITNVQEEIRNISFVIYPNPARELAYVEYDGNAFVDVLDITGKILHSYRHTTNQSALDLKRFESGVYFIRLTSNGKTWTKKLIVN